jgi:hypothetical protein
MKQDLYVEKFMLLARPVVDLEVKWTLKCVLFIEMHGIWNYTAEIVVVYGCETWLFLLSQVLKFLASWSAVRSQESLLSIEANSSVREHFSIINLVYGVSFENFVTTYFSQSLLLLSLCLYSSFIYLGFNQHVGIGSTDITSCTYFL